MENLDKPTLENYKKKVAEYLLLGDLGVVDIIAGATIGNRLDRDPIWIIITGPSASGKTELLNPLSKLPFVTSVSDLTVNTFASGYKMGGGKQASLLLQMQNGILVFKDFTTLLTKGKEARDAIMGQLREIYDGKFEKRTGTGEEIMWQGKIGVIAASTNAVYKALANTTEMGQRFIYYSVEQPDRFETACKAHENSSRSVEMRAMLMEEYKRWVTYILDQMENNKNIRYELPENLRMEMLRVADFSSLARTPVSKDFKSGLIDEEPDKEMPGRIVKQLEGLISGFYVINQAEGLKLPPGKEITDLQRHATYRCGYDSIPNMRRKILRLLAKHIPGVMTTGVATAMHMPTDSVRKILQELDALGLCRRQKEGGPQGDKWVMSNDHYRNVVVIVEKIKPENTILMGKEEDYEDEKEESYAQKIIKSANPEMEEQAEVDFNNF